MCKLFEKKFTAIEIKENVLQHLQFALTWPSMTYVLTVHRMLYFSLQYSMYFFLLLKCNTKVYSRRFSIMNAQIIVILNILITKCLTIIMIMQLLTRKL